MSDLVYIRTIEARELRVGDVLVFYAQELEVTALQWHPTVKEILYVHTTQDKNRRYLSTHRLQVRCPPLFAEHSIPSLEAAAREPKDRTRVKKLRDLK